MNIRQWLRTPISKYSARVIFKWLWRVWRGNRLQVIFNAAISLLSIVVSLAQVWAVQHVIDVASGHTEGSIYWSVGVMALLALCGFALCTCSIWVHNILGIKVQNRMQQRMLDRILRLEWTGKEPHHSGDVLNRLE